MKKTSKISLLLALSMAASAFTGCITGFAAAPDETPVAGYEDVGEEHWAYPWVSYMTGEGYIHGYPTADNDGQQVYKPDQYITRAEFVTILNFMLAPRGTMSESFTDVNEDDWFYGYINKAVATGYLSGYGDGTIKPNAYITREEASSIVYRAFKLEKYVKATSFADEDEISPWAYEAVMSLAELGVIVGYTGEAEDAARVQPKVNIKRAEVASLLANADKFYPAQVILSEEATATFDSDKGGTASFDAVPKNVSDNLTVSVKADTDNAYTITYTQGGSTVTVTPEEFANVVFTSDDLKKANITVNFPFAKDGDTVNVSVVVTDNSLDGEDKTVGSENYEVTFSGTAVEPTPTATPSTTISGGSGSSRTHDVTINIVDDNDEIISTTTETVANRGTVTDKLPTLPDSESSDKAYAWYTDPNYKNVFDIDTPITSDLTLYAKVETRDRVIESLKGYQATKNATGADEIANVLSTDVVDETLTVPYENKTWWTNDMLEVVVTNDKNKLDDGDIGDDSIINPDLRAVYDDVIRYVSEQAAFANVGVSKDNKIKYATYFRAMVKTINAAAEDAINTYKQFVDEGKSREEAYDAFNKAALQSFANSMSAEALEDEYNVEAMAVSYLAAMFTNSGEYAGIQQALAETEPEDLTVAKVGELLQNSLIYPKK